MKLLTIFLVTLVLASAYAGGSVKKCTYTSDGKPMEEKFWRPAGVWKTVKGMRTWCNNNCVRCNVACHGITSHGTCR